MWTIETKLYNNLKASKMKFLPTVIGCTKEDQIRNEDIGPTKVVTDFCITEKVTGPGEQYLAHAERMEDDRISN
jgi:hypothetical protein